MEFLGGLVTGYWCHWSNLRFRKKERFNTEVKEEDQVKTVADIKALTKKLIKNFTWVEDGPDQLWDAILPPPEMYKSWVENKLTVGDCDDYHSLLYHCLHNCGMECYLLSVNATKGDSGHCIMIFKLNDLWHVIDYGTVYNGFSTAQESIDNYNENYVKVYDCKPGAKVFFNGLVKYDYTKGKFKNSRVSKLK